jgi:mono/diheme cytochrome c family protein
VSKGRRWLASVIVTLSIAGAWALALLSSSQTLDPGAPAIAAEARSMAAARRTMGLSLAGGRGGDDGTSADAEYGRQLFQQTCSSCHGVLAQGLPRQGADLRTSEFVATQGDEALMAFIKTGRLPKDPKSRLGLEMPPRGGNQSINDAQLVRIIRFLRVVQRQASAAGEAPARAAAGPGPTSATANVIP